MNKELQGLLQSQKDHAKVLDVGCLGYTLFNQCKHQSLEHHGIDYVIDELPPPDRYTFKQVDLNLEQIPYPDDFFDCVVANHVIEHLENPLDFFGDCLRVLKPGGRLYIEAPSERSLKCSGMPFAWDQFYSLSFYDDPTHHHRPWPPAALYRLAKYYSAIPERAGYIYSWKARLAFPFLYPLARLFKWGKLLERLVWGFYGWASFVVVQKPNSLSGSLPFRYYIPKR